MVDGQYDGMTLPRSVVKRLNELAALAELNHEIHSTMRVDRLLQILVEKAVVGVNFERCLIYLLEGDFLKCVAFLDGIKKERASIIQNHVGFHMNEVAVETLSAKLGKSVYVTNTKTDHRMSKKFLKVSDTTEYCVVPLIGREGVLGVFTGDKFYSKEPIQPEDIKTLELMVGHISLAIDNARLYEEKENFNRILEEKVSARTSELSKANRKLADEKAKVSALYNMANLLNSSLELEQILEKMLNVLQRMGHEDCAVYLLGKTRGLSAASPSLSLGSKAFRRIPLTDEFLETLRTDTASVSVHPIDNAAMKREALNHCHKHGFMEVWAIPIRREAELMGIVVDLSMTSGGMGEEQTDFFLAFCQQASLALENAVAFRRMQENKRSAQELTKRLELENMYLRDRTQGGFNHRFVAGKTESMARIMDSIYKVAPTSTTVIIYGETGTGKELIGKSIHALSPRRDKPLITLNCAAIPDNLLESELFGHEKGAFTGAQEKKVGMFELAAGGTIFLDEIGEISLQTQAKLLRVLQEHEIQPLGAKKSLKIDVRIVSATNRDLKRRAEEGLFRTDLYYRLNVFPILMPPLRERAEDIDDLVDFFTDKYSCLRGKKINLDQDARQLLRGYAWPGNIRELENIIERLTIISDSDLIEKKDLPREIARGEGARKPMRPLREAMDEFKRSMVMRALTEAGGRRSKAAEMLSLQKSNFSRLLKDLGIR